MLNYSIPKHKIDHIFITHLHGDHFFGLIGLITSYHLAGRTRPLEIFSPKGLEEIIRIQLSANGKNSMSYELIFHEINHEQSELIYQNNLIEVFSIPLRHRVITCGYLFKEKRRLPNISKAKVAEYNLSAEQIIQLKNNQSIQLETGEVIEPTDVLRQIFESRSYAYCSDTAYAPEICEIIESADILYHEATFINKDETLAEQTLHSTAGQAAAIALKAGVKRLILGHLSSRYKYHHEILKEAVEIFPETTLANEGMVLEIGIKKLIN